jgi:hypothetical protein
MRRIKKISLLVILLAFIALQGTSADYYGNYSEYYAVYMDRTNLEKSVFYIETGKDMKNLGKIYHKHPYLFVNEKYKGVHVIDNTDPANPVKKGFIVAPGCLDMAVKEDVIYLDNAVDLVSFDLSQMKETKRIPNILPEPISPNGQYYEGQYYAYNRPEGLILVEWVKR